MLAVRSLLVTGILALMLTAPADARKTRKPHASSKPKATTSAPAATPASEPIAAAPASASPESLETRYLTNEGSSLAYLRAGQGEAVVFLPDSGEDLDSWRPQVTTLAEHYQALAYIRRPAFGTRPSVHTPTAHDVRDFATLLTAFSLGTVHLVGEGDGARMALHFALARPDLVRSLTLVSPDARWFPKPNELEAARAGNLPAASGIDTLLACQRVWTVHAPMLVMRRAGAPDPGGADPLRCIRNARQSRINATNARLHVENADEFNQAVLKFIERLPISAGTP